MKRCTKLIHLILEYAEQHARGGPLVVPEFPGHSEDQVEYHVKLAAQAGYVEVSDGRFITDVTWDGHEELKRWRADSAHSCS